MSTKKKNGMKTPNAKTGREAALEKKRAHGLLARETAGGAAGGAIGAMLGMVGGPPGAVVGAVLGAAVGAVAENAVERGNAAESRRDEELDEIIGVSGGEMGAPNLEHPPATGGAVYSAAALGSAASSEPQPAEGPMQTPGDG